MQSVICVRVFHRVLRQALWLQCFGLVSASCLFLPREEVLNPWEDDILLRPPSLIYPWKRTRYAIVARTHTHTHSKRVTYRLKAETEFPTETRLPQILYRVRLYSPTSATCVGWWWETALSEALLDPCLLSDKHLLLFSVCLPFRCSTSL